MTTQNRSEYVTINILILSQDTRIRILKELTDYYGDLVLDLTKQNIHQPDVPSCIESVEETGAAIRNIVQTITDYL
mgnify:CR=1 FL=1